MPADDHPEVPADLLDQLHGALERLNAAVGRIPGVAQAAAHLPPMPSIPAPGQTTAAQLAAITGAIRAQRSAIATMRTSLDAFEQQLEVLQRVLEPIEALSKAWAKLERRVTR